VPDRLPVHANRQELHSLEVPPSFETDDSFVIAVQNHGEACRVHTVLDGTLDDVASIEETNHYVEANATKAIGVNVHERRPVFGKIKLVVGYGAATRWVDVELTEPTKDAGTVEVDEDLARPRPSEEPDTGVAATLSDRPAIPLFALGAVALLVAVGAAIVSQSPVVAAGATLVLATVVVTAYLAVT